MCACMFRYSYLLIGLKFTEKLFAERKYLRITLNPLPIPKPQIKLTYSLEEKLNECLKLHMLTFNFIRHTVC